MQSESEKVPSVRVWRRNRPSRRNHERCKQASLASHSERGGFCNIGSCGCLHTYNCLYCKRYSATQNLPMMSVYIRGSVRERRSKAQRLRQFRLSNYCRADAVKDGRQRSQSRLNEYTLPNRRYIPQRLFALWIASGEKKFRLFIFFIADCQKLSKTQGYF